jgi:hypothetical protein
MPQRNARRDRRARTRPSADTRPPSPASDGSRESPPARQPDSPPGSDPQPVLLVVDRHHPLGPAALGEERVEAIEPTDIEHAHPGKIGRRHRHAVAVVARGTRRVDALGAIQREGVKPERHRLHGRPSELRGDLERQQVGHLALGLGNDKPLSATGAGTRCLHTASSSPRVDCSLRYTSAIPALPWTPAKAVKASYPLALTALGPVGFPQHAAEEEDPLARIDRRHCGVTSAGIDSPTHGLQRGKVRGR